MGDIVTKHNFTPNSGFIFIQHYTKLKFKVTTLSPAQTEVKNNLNYKPQMLLHFPPLKSSTPQ